jgi:N-ethylmaleimide reductase
MHRSGAGSLFSPIRLGALALPNRIVMAPMTRSRAGAGNVPTEVSATYYAQRASAGLIITEAAHVSPEGVGYPGTPGIHDQAQLIGWREVTRAVHAQGGRIFVQLWHVGRVSHPCMQPGGALPVAPSAIAAQGALVTRLGLQEFVRPRALLAEEIPGIVQQFAEAARLAREAGFDGVDIHAANGYLIDQFLRDGSNHRLDEYGGSVQNRARFLLEVTAAVASVWEKGSVGVRLSPLSPYNSMHDSDPVGTFGYAAAALDRLGIGYLHVAQPGPGHPLASPEGVEMLRTLRSLFRGCLMVDGGRDELSAREVLDAVGADLVAFATPFIANPDLVMRLEQGLPLASPDPSTYYEGGTRGYIDYPAVSFPGPQPSVSR